MGDERRYTEMRLCGSGLVMAVLAFLGLMLAASPVHAEVYKWTDESGTIWFTDDPANLPEQSHGQVEKEKAPEKASESSSPEKAPSPSATRTKATGSSKEYLEDRDQRVEEKKRLEKEISSLEKELSTARRALQRVPVGDRRGFWFVINSAGSKVRASYKDPGAIWSNATWPGAPRASRTTESEERRRIQSDILELEEDLNRATERLSALSRGL